MVVQMAVLNIYHKAPPTPVPEWLKVLIRRLPCMGGSERVQDVPTNEKQKENHVEEVNTAAETAGEKQLCVEGSGILNEVCKITDRLESHFIGEDLREEWKIVGRILDRFLFFIFVTVHLVLFIITIARV